MPTITKAGSVEKANKVGKGPTLLRPGRVRGIAQRREGQRLKAGLKTQDLTGRRGVEGADPAGPEPQGMGGENKVVHGDRHINIDIALSIPPRPSLGLHPASADHKRRLN